MGHEVVLLVDDEEAVRRFAAQVLESCGYTVFEANDGQHALEVTKAHRWDIDLLVTDLAMPGIDGLRLADLLREQNPHLKVLFVSGNSSLSETTSSIDPANRFLHKPFTVSSLARRVREILDEVLREEVRGLEQPIVAIGAATRYASAIVG